MEILTSPKNTFKVQKSFFMTENGKKVKGGQLSDFKKFSSRIVPKKTEDFALWGRDFTLLRLETYPFRHIRVCLRRKLL